MKGALLARKTLTNHEGILVDQNAHERAPAMLTAFLAASVRSLAGVMASPLLARISRAKGALVPSRRTMTAILTPTSLTAAIIPSALISQRTIPPKILIKIAVTLGLDRISLNPSATPSFVPPPPTPRKCTN